MGQTRRCQSARTGLRLSPETLLISQYDSTLILAAIFRDRLSCVKQFGSNPSRRVNLHNNARARCVWLIQKHNRLVIEKRRMRHVVLSRYDDFGICSIRIRNADFTTKFTRNEYDFLRVRRIRGFENSLLGQVKTMAKPYPKRLQPKAGKRSAT